MATPVRQKLSDSEYIWVLIREMDKIPQPAPEMVDHRLRLVKIAKVLSAVDYFSARLKSAKRKQQDSSVESA